MKEVQPIFQDPFAAFSPLKKVETYLYETAYNFGIATRVNADEHVDGALNAVGLVAAERSRVAIPTSSRAGRCSASPSRAR